MAKEYKVAGITRYVENILQIATENDDFRLPAKELIEIYSDGDRVEKYDFNFTHAELVPEPENPFDSNAVRVELDGIIIGYVPRDDSYYVLNEMNSDNYGGIEITQIHYGDFKKIVEDEDGELHVQKDRYNYPFARFQLLTKADSPAPTQLAPEPMAAAPERPPLDKKTKFGAASTLVLIFGIIMMFVAMPIGLILFIVGIVLLIRSRRS